MRVIGGLAEFYVADVLLLVAIVATNDAVNLVDNTEVGLHWFVVCDALWVLTLDDATELIRRFHHLLLYNLIIADKAEDNLRCDNREARDFFVREISVGHLDDAFLSNLCGRIALTDGYGRRELVELKKGCDLVGLVEWYMVDYGAVFDGSDESFFFVHSFLVFFLALPREALGLIIACFFALTREARGQSSARHEGGD